MPTYAYQCNACQHRLEEFQWMSEKPLRVCPKCKRRTLKRQLGVPELLFKGSGFYITDYRRPGGRSEDKKEGHRDNQKKGAGEVSSKKPVSTARQNPSTSSAAPESTSSSKGKPGKEK